MFLYSPVLTGVFLLTAPLYVLLMRASTRWLKPVFDSLEEAFGRYGSAQIDAIKGIETVKALGAESSLRQILLNQFHGLARKQFRADFTMMTYQGAVTGVSFLSTTIFLWAGAHQVMAGALTIGGLVAFNSLVALANMPITTLLSMWDSFQLGSVLLDRLNDVFDQAPEQGEDRTGLLPVRSLEGRVDAERFEQVRAFLAIQEKEARWWRDASVLYFQAFSGRPLPEGYERPELDLGWYQAIRKRYVPGN